MNMTRNTKTSQLGHIQNIKFSDVCFTLKDVKRCWEKGKKRKERKKERKKKKKKRKKIYYLLYFVVKVFKQDVSKLARDSFLLRNPSKKSPNRRKPNRTPSKEIPIRENRENPIRPKSDPRHERDPKRRPPLFHLPTRKKTARRIKNPSNRE